MNGSSDRYFFRQKIWKEKHRVLPSVRHHGWWLLHNVVSHPLLGVRVSPRTIWFHDWTSMHLNQRKKVFPSPSPQIPPDKKHLWVFHNIVGHVAIGLFPVESSFRFHDKTSFVMDVPDWV